MAFNDIHLIDRNPFADGLSNNPKSKKAEKEKKGKNIRLGNNSKDESHDWELEHELNEQSQKYYISPKFVDYFTLF